jgi:Protein of unknown function DUF262
MDYRQFSPVVKPETYQIFEIVRDAVAGRLRIPNFQRSYVWRRDQMLELLDSIRRRYPIGSLLVWETGEEVSFKTNIGPIRIPQQSEFVTSLVLDGHQRISTLTGSLMEPTAGTQLEDDPDPGRWEIWFDAKSEDFLHLGKGEQPQSWHFPMRKLMDTVAFLDECERMRRDGGAGGELYVRRAQELLRVFVDQLIPVVKIKNTNLLQAVNIFARLNSTGKKISADEMAEAITYKEDGKTLAYHITELTEVLDGYGFGGIDRTIVLRAILACMGEDIYRTDWTRFDDSKRSELQRKLEAVIRPTMAAMEQAAKFLNHIGVNHDRLLPYAQQLVVLTAFFHGCNQPTIQQQNFLTRWFWVSSFSGWFASGNPSRVSALVREMGEKVARHSSPDSLENMRMDEPAQPFPKDFDMRSARTRTWLLFLLSLKPIDSEGQVYTEPWRLVASHGPYALGYIAATVKDKELSASPTNRILRLEPTNRSQAMNWLTKLKPEICDVVLKSHGIPPSSLRLLQEGDRDEFLRVRRDYLINLEIDFMKKKGVTVPSDITPKASPIDNE